MVLRGNLLSVRLRPHGRDAFRGLLCWSPYQDTQLRRWMTGAAARCPGVKHRGSDAPYTLLLCAGG